MKFLSHAGEDICLILAQPNRRIPPLLKPSLPFTDIETAIGAREQRRTFGRSSRYTYEYTPWLRNAGFATEFRLGLNRLKDEPVAVPLWDDFVKLSAACTSGATTLQKTSDNPARFGAEWLIVAPEPAAWNAWTYEIVTVTAVSAGTLTLAAPGTANAWPAGTLIYPLLFGRLERPTLDSRTPQKVEGALRIREDSPFARRLNPYPVGHQICGNGVPNFITTPVWDIEPNWVQVLDTTAVDAIYQQVGFLRQEQRYFYLQSNRRGLEFEVVCRTRAQIAKVENLFMNRLGTTKPFFVPTFRQDMVITADLPQPDPDASEIPVESSAYSDPDRPIHPGDPYIALLEPGLVSAIKLDHVLGNILFTEVPVATTHLRRNTRLSHLHYSRFAKPEITWDYSTPQRATCRVSFIEVPDEYVTPATNVIEPAYLYKFTTVLPTLQVQYFTSYENTITWGTTDDAFAHVDVPDPETVWTPAPFSHGSIKSGLRLDKEECEITSWGGNFPGNPLAGLFPFTLEGQLFLDIIEVNAADPSDDYARILFAGYITRPRMAGKDWQVLCRWGGNSFDRNIPRIYFQKTNNVAIYATKYTGVDKADFGIACTFHGAPGTNTVVDLDGGADKPEDYFAGGYCETGAGANFERRPILHSEVAVTGRLEITIDKRFRNAVADQAIALYPGTNGSLEQFIALAGSPENFRGYPYIPIKDPSTNIGEVANNAGGKKG